MTGLRVAFEELCACFVVSLLLSLYSTQTHTHMHAHVFYAHSTRCSLVYFIFGLSSSHIHKHINYFYSLYVRKCTTNSKPCSCLYKIFSTLRSSVNGVCHLYICLFPECAVLSVFVTRYLAFIFTQELKMRPYSPSHLASLWCVCVCVDVSRTFFPLNATSFSLVAYFFFFFVGNGFVATALRNQRRREKTQSEKNKQFLCKDVRLSFHPYNCIKKTFLVDGKLFPHL